jgi:hypothetical protein
VWKDIFTVKNNHEDNAAIDMPIIDEHPPDEIRRRVAVAEQCHGSGCNIRIRIIGMGVCAYHSRSYAAAALLAQHQHQEHQQQNDDDVKLSF